MPSISLAMLLGQAGGCCPQGGEERGCGEEGGAAQQQVQASLRVMGRGLPWELEGGIGWEPLELDQIRCQLSASCKLYQKQLGSCMCGRLLWGGCCKGSPKSEGRGSAFQGRQERFMILSPLSLPAHCLPGKA